MTRSRLADHRAILLAGLAGLALVAWLALAPSQASAFNCLLDTESSNDGTDPGALNAGANSLWETDEDDGEWEDAMLVKGGLGFGRYDAFDGYGMATIGVNDYDNPDTDGCTRVNNGHGLRFPGDTTVLGGLTVIPELYADPKKPFGRQLVLLRNTTGGPITFDFEFDGDLGSDSATNVDRTSSGNGIAAANDVWATSCEDVNTNGCATVQNSERFRDPELAHNWERKGKKPDSADVITFADADSIIDVEFDDVTVPAGKTFAYMEVVTLGRSIKAVRKAAPRIAKNPKDYGVFKGLTKAERRALRNW